MNDLSVDSQFGNVMAGVQNRQAGRDGRGHGVEVGETACLRRGDCQGCRHHATPAVTHVVMAARSEEHTSELQSLMRISYAVFCLKKKKRITTIRYTSDNHTTTIQHTVTPYYKY